MEIENGGFRSIPWQEMQSELLTKVFSYLDIEDRLNVRQTCVRWNDVCLQPMFWRERRFELRGKGANDRWRVAPYVDRLIPSFVRARYFSLGKQGVNEDWRVSRYVEAFGAHLKEVTITLHREDEGWWELLARRQAQTRKIACELHRLLQDLKNTKQLQSFYCHQLRLCFLFDDCYKAELMTSFCNMLEQQKLLSVVSFTDCELEEEDGCQLLLTLATNSTVSRITSMKLINFFVCFPYEEDNWIHCPQFLEAMARFRNLKTVTLSYHYMSDSVLVTLMKASPVLRYIVLCVLFDDNRPLPGTLPCWKLAVRKRPELCVAVSMGVTSPQYPYHDYLLPALPLVHVSFDMIDYYEEKPDKWVEKKIFSATRSLLHYDSLKSVILKQTKYRGIDEAPLPSSALRPWNRSEALVELVDVCTSLTHLCLDMTLTLPTLLRVAAAAQSHHRGRRGAGEGELSAAHAVPEQPMFHIHITGCVVTQVGKSVQESVSDVNPFCVVHICKGCDPLWLLPKTDFI